MNQNENKVKKYHRKQKHTHTDTHVNYLFIQLTRPFLAVKFSDLIVFHLERCQNLQTSIKNDVTRRNARILFTKFLFLINNFSAPNYCSRKFIWTLQ